MHKLRALRHHTPSRCKYTHMHIDTQCFKRASQPNNCGAFVSLSQLADSYRAKHNSLTLREY